MDIGFSYSTSLITVIILEKNYLAINESINNEIFIMFIDKLKNFIEINVKITIDRFFVLFDNALKYFNIKIKNNIKNQ